MLPQSVANQLARMSPEQRAAFAAGAAERVFDLYMDCAKPYRDHVWNAIELAWSRASGASLAGDAVARLLAELDRESGQYCDTQNQSIDLPFGAIVAASHALRAAHSGEVKEAILAADFASGEAARADRDDAGGEQEEIDWQLDWLKHTSAADPGAARDEFKARAATKPAWYERWSS